MFAHCLRKVDMRAVIGQTSQASVVIRGAHSTRRVACYSSHPDELQVAPGSFVLVAGALTELLLSFRPVTQGLREIKVRFDSVDGWHVICHPNPSNSGLLPPINRFTLSTPRHESWYTPSSSLQRRKAPSSLGGWPYLEG